MAQYKEVAERFKETLFDHNQRLVAALGTARQQEIEHLTSSTQEADAALIVWLLARDATCLRSCSKPRTHKKATGRS